MTNKNQLDSEAWGPEPSEEEWRELEQLDAKLLGEEREQLSARSASIEDVAAAVARSADEVETALRKGELIAFDYRGERLIPLWQLTDERPARIVDGISEVRQAFGGDILVLSTWAESPNPHLAGQTPKEVLAEGDLDTVLNAVASIGAAA